MTTGPRQSVAREARIACSSLRAITSLPLRSPNPPGMTIRLSAERLPIVSSIASSARAASTLTMNRSTRSGSSARLGTQLAAERGIEWHVLDQQEALHRATAMPLLHVRQRRLHGRRLLDDDLDTADLALVQDLGRHHLDHHPIACQQAEVDVVGLVRIAHEKPGRCRHPERAQHLEPLGLEQSGPSARAGGVQDVADGRAIDLHRRNLPGFADGVLSPSERDQRSYIERPKSSSTPIGAGLLSRSLDSAE